MIGSVRKLRVAKNYAAARSWYFHNLYAILDYGRKQANKSTQLILYSITEAMMTFVMLMVAKKIITNTTVVHPFLIHYSERCKEGR